MSGVLLTKPLKILEATWVTGAEFVLPGQVCQISLQDHAGGTWSLQHFVNGAWVDLAGDDEDTTMRWDTESDSDPLCQSANALPAVRRGRGSRCGGVCLFRSRHRGRHSLPHRQGR